MEKDNGLFAIYSPRIVDDEGKTITAEVIAQFAFTNNQIQRTHGQVRFIPNGHENAPKKLDMSS